MYYIIDQCANKQKERTQANEGAAGKTVIGDPQNPWLTLMLGSLTWARAELLCPGTLWLQWIVQGCSTAATAQGCNIAVLMRRFLTAGCTNSLTLHVSTLAFSLLTATAGSPAFSNVAWFCFPNRLSGVTTIVISLPSLRAVSRRTMFSWPLLVCTR